MQAYTSIFYNMLNCFLNCKLKSILSAKILFIHLKGKKKLWLTVNFQWLIEDERGLRTWNEKTTLWNTTDDSSFEGMMIACIGRLKNKLCKRKEKSLYSTRKNPFSPTTIYKKQGRECAMITYTLKHTHT